MISALLFGSDVTLFLFNEILNASCHVKFFVLTGNPCSSSSQPLFSMVPMLLLKVGKPDVSDKGTSKSRSLLVRLYQSTVPPTRLLNNSKSAPISACRLD